MHPWTFDQFLTASVNAGASDIHIKAHAQPILRVHGILKEVKLEPMSDEMMQGLVGHILEYSRCRGAVDELKELDTFYHVDDCGRFRVHLLRENGGFAMVLRPIPGEIPGWQQLGLPESARKLAQLNGGLVLVAGGTGSGKSTTLAAMVNEMNLQTRKHIVTIENPIEFIHEDHLSWVTQREVGRDTESFATALRGVLRQDPDVILLSEMNDPDTVDAALNAVENGHFVLSAVPKCGAAQAIKHLVDIFHPQVRKGVRQRLAEVLRGIVSQRLVCRLNEAGRVLVAEVMVMSPASRELVAEPSRASELKNYMERGRQEYGTQSFDQHLMDLYKRGIISLETVRMVAGRNPADQEREKRS